MNNSYYHQPDLLFEQIADSEDLVIPNEKEPTNAELDLCLFKEENKEDAKKLLHDHQEKIIKIHKAKLNR